MNNYTGYRLIINPNLWFWQQIMFTVLFVFMINFFNNAEKR